MGTADMPRKPNAGPPILRIETMSDGRVWPPPVSVGHDDFTGQSIPVAQPNAPIKPPLSAQDVQDAHNRRQLAAKRALLEHVGIIPSAPKPQVANVPGMRPIGRLGGQVVYGPRAGFRRI